MGNSVGSEYGIGAGTLGPIIQAQGVDYHLVCYHVFDDDTDELGAWADDSPLPLRISHPCGANRSPGESRQGLGRLVAYSGKIYDTCRVSRSTRRLAGRNHTIQTDWALCACHKDALPFKNQLCTFPPAGQLERYDTPLTHKFDSDFSGG